MRPGGVGEEEPRQRRDDPAGGSFGQRSYLKVAHATGPLHDARPDCGRRGDPARVQVAGCDLQRLPRRPAEHDDPSPGPEQLQRAAADVAADAVERQRDVTPLEGLLDHLGPLGLAVVDDDVSPHRPGPLGLVWAAGGADYDRTDVVHRLHEEAADATGGGGHQRHVLRRRLCHLQDAHRGSAGSDHGHRHVGGQVIGQLVQGTDRRQRQLRVATARHAEVGHHAAPAPRLIGARAHGVDATRHLAARNHGQVRQWEGTAGLALADHGVQQVHAYGLHGDAHLVLGRGRVGDLLVEQVLGGTELMLSNRVHFRER
jgi:hypothetical protein